jgi:hypothetical protein
MIDCMACCSAVLSAAILAAAALDADEDDTVDIEMLRAFVNLRDRRNDNSGCQAKPASNSQKPDNAL